MLIFDQRLKKDTTRSLARNSLSASNCRPEFSNTRPGHPTSGSIIFWDIVTLIMHTYINLSALNYFDKQMISVIDLPSYTC